MGETEPKVGVRRDVFPWLEDASIAEVACSATCMASTSH
jgi:hypothetical protein